METVLIPVEKEIKQWMKEAMKEFFDETKSFQNIVKEIPEPLVSRKEIASFLNISLVTLRDWVKEVCHLIKKEDECILYDPKF